MAGEMVLSKPTEWGRLATGDILAFIWTDHPRPWSLSQLFIIKTKVKGMQSGT